MKYYAITKDEMLQGEGLRVALWVAGCEQKCKGCHNPHTWDKDRGKVFDLQACVELFEELSKPYISGITILGGNPTEDYNIFFVTELCKDIKNSFPNKTIWIYSGHLWEELKDLELLKYIDVLVDGKFVEELRDETYHWAGSTNQRVIDVKSSLSKKEVVLYESCSD